MLNLLYSIVIYNSKRSPCSPIIVRKRPFSLELISSRPSKNRESFFHLFILKDRFFTKENQCYSFVELTDGVFTHKDLPSLYALSYMYYATLGTLIGIIVGILVSWFSKTKDSDLQNLNPDLVAPVMRRWLPKSKLLPPKYEYHQANRDENKCDEP